MDKPKRVAIYARVSTTAKGQDPENQLIELREWCSAKGYPIVNEYVDFVSGGKGVSKRDQLALMMADASKAKFDLVLVWALDRLSREGMFAMVEYIKRLSSFGVQYHSYTEPLLTSENEMVRDIMLAVQSSMAKAEMQKLSLRTKAGIAKARKNGTRSGKTIGGQAIDATVRQRVIREAGKGKSAYAIGKLLGVDRKTAAKYMEAP